MADLVGSPISTNLIQGSSPPGSVVISGVVVDGITVDGTIPSSHGSRHNPTGADPLATAAPITDVSPGITSDPGVATTLARSDHSHAYFDNGEGHLATALRTTGAPVVVSTSAPPLQGFHLRTTSPTNAVWVGSFFGAQYESDIDTSSLQTTSATFVNKQTFTTSVKTTGSFIIAWQYNWACLTNLGGLEVRVTVDGTTEALPQRTTFLPNNFTADMGFVNLVFGSSQTHTINIDMRTTNGGNAVQINNSRIIIFLVS